MASGGEELGMPRQDEESARAVAAKSAAIWLLKNVSCNVSPKTTQEIEISRGEIIKAGRDLKSCQLRLVDEYRKAASRIHAKVFVNERGSLFVEDMRSLNGVLVNGELVKENTQRQLFPNDIVSFGGRTNISGGRSAAQVLERLPGDISFCYKVSVRPSSNVASSSRTTAHATTALVSGDTDTPNVSREATMDPKLMEMLECSLCLELMEMPILLSCSHSFCRNCWLDWVERQEVNLKQETSSASAAAAAASRKRKRKSRTGDCPTCRKSVPVDAPVVLALQNLIEGVKDSGVEIGTNSSVFSSRSAASSTAPESADALVAKLRRARRIDSSKKRNVTKGKAAQTFASSDSESNHDENDDQDYDEEEEEEENSEGGGSRARSKAKLSSQRSRTQHVVQQQIPRPAQIRHRIGEYPSLRDQSTKTGGGDEDSNGIANEESSKASLQGFSQKIVLRRSRHENFGVDIDTCQYRGYMALKVSACDKDSQGWRKGLRPNDLLCEVNGYLCFNLKESNRYEAVTEAFKEDSVVSIKILRGLIIEED